MNPEMFKCVLNNQEPSLGYNGKEYSICFPDGKYYVWAEDSPGDTDLVFQDPDDLLDHWMIQGQSLRSILPFIDFGD